MQGSNRDIIDLYKAGGYNKNVFLPLANICGSTRSVGTEVPLGRAREDRRFYVNVRFWFFLNNVRTAKNGIMIVINMNRDRMRS